MRLHSAQTYQTFPRKLVQSTGFGDKLSILKWCCPFCFDSPSYQRGRKDSVPTIRVTSHVNSESESDHEFPFKHYSKAGKEDKDCGFYGETQSSHSSCSDEEVAAGVTKSSVKESTIDRNRSPVSVKSFVTDEPRTVTNLVASEDENIKYQSTIRWILNKNGNQAKKITQSPKLQHVQLSHLKKSPVGTNPRNVNRGPIHGQCPPMSPSAKIRNSPTTVRIKKPLPRIPLDRNTSKGSSNTLDNRALKINRRELVADVGIKRAQSEKLLLNKPKLDSIKTLNSDAEISSLVARKPRSSEDITKIVATLKKGAKESCLEEPINLRK